MIPVGIPSFCPGNWPGSSLQQRQWYLSEISISSVPLLPQGHSITTQRRRDKPGSCPLQTQPAGTPCWIPVPGTGPVTKATAPCPFPIPCPRIPMCCTSCSRHLEQRASHGLSVWARAGMEGGQHKEQHFGQEMEKRSLLPESREQPPAKGAAKVSQHCWTLHKLFTLLKLGEKLPTENSVNSQSSAWRGTGNRLRRVGKVNTHPSHFCSIPQCDWVQFLEL